MEGGGGRHQDHGLVALFLEVLVGVLQQLAGVTLALHIGAGGQSVDIAHGDFLSLGGQNAAGQHGGHGVNLPFVLHHQNLVGGAELLVEDVNVGSGIPKTLFPEILLLGDLLGGRRANVDHNRFLLQVR